MIEYSVSEVCFKPWAEKVRRYWSFVGKCPPCFVLLGKCEYAQILLLERRVEQERAYGLLFNKPVRVIKIRNLIWHEVGHIKSSRIDDPIDTEFFADKWAVEESERRGYKKVTEEIVFRCLDFLSLEEGDTYLESSKKLLSHFYKLINERKIIEKYKKKMKLEV